MGVTIGQNIESLVASESTKLLPHVASFVAVVSAGSFSRAARLSGIDKTVLSRRIRHLEATLGVRLLNRTTRSLHVTEVGRRLYDQAHAPVGDILLGLAQATSSDAASGRVRLASISSMDRLLVEIAGRLKVEHPELRLEIGNADTLVDEGFDLAIRAGHLPDSSLVARKLAQWRYVLLAAPRWVEAHPEVRHPGDLADHWLLYSDVPNAGKWLFERGDEGAEVHMRPVLGANDSFVLRSAALAGLGVTAFPPYMVEEEVARGELIPLLSEWQVGHQIPIWGVVPHRSYVPARVQVVLAMAEQVFKEHQGRWAALGGV